MKRDIITELKALRLHGMAATWADLIEQNKGELDGSRWLIEQMLRACVRDRELLPAAQSIDVRFHEFNADDLGTVQRIYNLAGQPLTAALRSGMQQFIRENPRGKEGKIAYDLAVLGLDEAELRQRLRFYSERFATLDERIG